MSPRDNIEEVTLMIRIKGQEEYTVWCENCKKALIFDSPEDLIKANNKMYCIVCPLCKKDIWFHEFDTNTIMDPNFTKNIKYADINQQKVAAESFQKRLKELRDETQKLEEFTANLEADSSPYYDLF